MKRPSRSPAWMLQCICTRTGGNWWFAPQSSGVSCGPHARDKDVPIWSLDSLFYSSKPQSFPNFSSIRGYSFGLSRHAVFTVTRLKTPHHLVHLDRHLLPLLGSGQFGQTMSVLPSPVLDAPDFEKVILSKAQCSRTLSTNVHRTPPRLLLAHCSNLKRMSTKRHMWSPRALRFQRLSTCQRNLMENQYPYQASSFCPTLLAPIQKAIRMWHGHIERAGQPQIMPLRTTKTYGNISLPRISSHSKAMLWSRRTTLGSASQQMHLKRLSCTNTWRLLAKEATLFNSIGAARTVFPELSKHSAVIGHSQGGGAAWAVPRKAPAGHIPG